MIPSAISFLYYINSMSSFYEKETATYQTNELNIITEHLDTVMKQVFEIADSTASMLVTAEPFAHYQEKSAYGKLQVRRYISNELVNRVLTYGDIDNLYLETFDREVFSPHDEEINALMFAQDAGDLSISQPGTDEIIPVHVADYKRYRNASKKYPYVISYRKYFNQYTPGHTVGMVQVDVAYDTIANAVDIERSSEKDYVVIVDRNEAVVYAPEEEWLGKKTGDIPDFPEEAGQHIADLQKQQTVYSKDVTVRSSAIQDCDWTVIQFSSNAPYIKAVHSARRTWLIVTLASLFAALGVGLFISTNVEDSIIQIISSMQQASRGNFEIDVHNMGNSEFSKLADAFNFMVIRIDALMKDNIKKEHEKTTIELAALNSKINSHFLYNTLNLVKLLAIKDRQPEIAEIIVALADILEYSYKDTDSLVKLNQELDFIRDYLLIQTRRLGKNITVLYHIDEKAVDCSIPKMIIQPIVENCVMHAFPDTEERAGQKDTIDISVENDTRSDQLVITVQDNGCGFDYSGTENLNGIGLKNVLQRLMIFYGDKYKYEIRSSRQTGTMIRLVLPYEDTAKNG
jgi:two-component system sensor histidine kinase YesM